MSPPARPTHRGVGGAGPGDASSELCGVPTQGSQRRLPVVCTRRTVLTGTCVAVAVAAAGCSSAQGDGAPPGDVPVVGVVSDVPVGGGMVFADERVVVTRPEASVLHAFSAVCTHQGCTVSAVQDDVIVCPCHASTFAAGDGAVVQGPADSPLRRREIVVEGASFRVV